MDLMAALTPTKKQINEVAELLEEDFGSATEAAKAVLQLAWSQYAERAKFMVVAALATASDENEAEAKVVVVGPYPSDTTARNAALSSQLADEAEWRWVVPIYGGTPAQLLTERRKAKQAEADAERNAEKYSFLVPLAARDQLEAELNALVDGKLTLEEIVAKHPGGGWMTEALAERAEGACHYCGASGVKITRDHIWPKSKGGVGAGWNIVAACEPCNQDKADSLPTCECDKCQRALQKYQQVQV